MTRETVDALILRAMAKYKGIGPAAEARYFKYVHQELAPLARALEAENEQLRATVAEYVKRVGERNA